VINTALTTQVKVDENNLKRQANPEAIRTMLQRAREMREQAPWLLERPRAVEDRPLAQFRMRRRRFFAEIDQQDSSLRRGLIAFGRRRMGVFLALLVT
jgi:hypothetical protein